MNSSSVAHSTSIVTREQMNEHYYSPLQAWIENWIENQKLEALSRAIDQMVQTALHCQ